MQSLDRNNVPEKLWQLLLYAAFWGISEDWTRGFLPEVAPDDVKENLSTVVGSFDSDLNEWLAGPEVESPQMSQEYVAFTAMRNAAEYA